MKKSFNFTFPDITLFIATKVLSHKNNREFYVEKE